VKEEVKNNDNFNSSNWPQRHYNNPALNLHQKVIAGFRPTLPTLEPTFPEESLLENDVNVGIFVVLMSMVYAAAMLWFFLHKRNPKNEGKTIGGFLYSWPDKK